MSGARQVEWPTGPAKLTDITVRREFPAKPAGRKSGDLSSDAVETTEETVAPTHSKADPRAHAPVASIATIALQHPKILHLEPSPTVFGRSDVFDFESLGGDDLEIVSPTAGDPELVSRRSPAPIFSLLADGIDDSSSEPSSVEVIPVGSASVTAAVTIDAGSSATEWCLLEQSHPVRTSPILDAAAYPMRGGAASDLIIVNDPRGYGHESHVTDRASFPQVITVVMGALLIVAGVALVAAPMWHEAHLRSVAMTAASDVGDLIGLDDVRAKLSLEGGWFGLAFILVGAALEAIGLRTRRMIYRT